jgi:outer membrane biosynthesis protein TonB
MDNKDKIQEDRNDQKATLMSLTIHVLLGILFFLPMGKPMRSIENTQIQVELPQELLGGGPALGLPNQGSGNNPAPGLPDPDAGNNESKPSPVPVPPPPPKPVFVKPTPTSPPRKVETTEDPNAAVIRRQAEQARQQAEERKYQEQAAARAKQQAEAAAAAQRQAEAAAKDKFKGRFGTGSGSGQNGGGGTGTGQGNTGKPGNQGQPDGDPNSKVLEGMGRGAGSINGFGSRGVRSAPRLQENSQKQGRVVLSVCVNSSGAVVSADFKAVGSTTTDDDLIEAAKRNARQYRFETGSADKQCGTITYNFIVK